MAEDRKRDLEQNAGARMRRELWEAREARRHRARILRAFLGVIVLAILTGLGIVYKNQIMAFLTPQPKTDIATPVPKPAPKEVAKPPEPPPQPNVVVPPSKETRDIPFVPTPPALVTTDDPAVKASIEQARLLVDQLEFGKVAALLKDAAQRKISPGVKSEVMEWARKAENFDLATRHIGTSKFALAETSYILQMNDGREMQGLKKEETETEFVLSRIPPENPATSGEVSCPLPKSEIAKITPVSRQQRQEAFLQTLGQLESNVSIQRSTDYYDLVYVSKRLGLNKECLTYLNRSYNGGPGHAPDPYLGDSFRKERIRRTIDQCSLMLAAGRAKHFVTAELNKLLKTFPDYQVAQDEVEAFKIQVLDRLREGFKSTLREVKKPAEVASAPNMPETKPQSAKEMASSGELGEPIVLEVEDDSVKGQGAAASIVEQANFKYREGMERYRRFRLGTNKDNNETLKEALALLVAAVDLYDKALREDPANKAILDRQTQANMTVYACRKYQTL